jgi:ATP-dependent DNA ligase
LKESYGTIRHYFGNSFRLGYKKRQKCYEFLDRDAHDWLNVKIIAFDAPQLAEKTYAERLDALKRGIPPDHVTITVASPVQCKGRDHLESFFDEICKDRPAYRCAEGVVIRDPKAWYYEKNSFFEKQVLIQL